LSGPGIINNSRKINNYLHEGKVSIQIDLFPHLDEGQLNKFILEIFDKNKNKKIKNVLEDIYPGNILETILKENSNLDLSRAVNDIRIEERKEIVKILKCINLTIAGLMGYEKAIVANGGIDPTEIDFKTMNLIQVSNLKITGDLIDISRPSGGYSLQLCWSTGFIAGNTLN
jgi:predicted Rossmann fold flavoprotein